MLSWARERTADARSAEADVLVAAVEWAAMNPPEHPDCAATYLTSYGDTGVMLAGPGAPAVSEFAVHEFATAIGLRSEAGKRVIGHALELAHRLPRTWARVRSGDVPAWVARRVAEHTLELPAEAAGFVDRQVAPVVHKVGLPTIERLVEEAIARHAPEQAARVEAASLDRRHVTLDTSQVGFDGTIDVAASLEILDALDLDHALRDVAAQLEALGSEDSLDGRRATALGELARTQLTLDLATAADGEPATAGAGVGAAGRAASETGDGADAGEPVWDAARSDEHRAASRGISGPPVARRRAAHQLVLHVHLAEAALASAPGPDGAEFHVARLEQHQRLVTADRVRAWCGHPDAQVVVKPVIDLADHVRVDAYEIPDRIKDRVALRDGHCVFPFCTRPARKARPDDHAADCDHIQRWTDGGETCACQLAPLCRQHHRAKTFSRWRYLVLGEPGTYLWTSPHGYQFLVDHTGTLDVSTDHPTGRLGGARRGEPTGDPPDH